MIQQEIKQNKFRVFLREFPRGSAFTLIELLIVVSILAILATVGIMNLYSHRSRQDLGFRAREIVTVLRNAQDRSISQEDGARWGVYFENPSSGTDFYELFSGPSYVSGTIFSKNTLSSYVQFDIPAANSSTTIIFSPITGLPTASATIKISLVGDSTASSTIIINSNGKINF